MLLSALVYLFFFAFNISLIRLFISLEYGFDSHPDDTQVEPQAPVLDVPDVALHTSLHLPKLAGLTTEARHLRPAGDARLDEMAYHILLDELIVLLSMSQHVRSWPHNTHIAYKDVPELRQLIDVCLAHEITERELARVVLSGLQTVGITIYMHGAELVAIEITPIESRATLSEEHGARALALDDDGNEG